MERGRGQFTDGSVVNVFMSERESSERGKEGVSQSVCKVLPILNSKKKKKIQYVSVDIVPGCHKYTTVWETLVDSTKNTEYHQM